jgi:hypothetical protein
LPEEKNRTPNVRTNTRAAETDFLAMGKDKGRATSQERNAMLNN